MMCSLVQPIIIINDNTNTNNRLIQYTIFGDQKTFTTPLFNAWNWDDLYEIGDAKRREAAAAVLDGAETKVAPVKRAAPRFLSFFSVRQWGEYNHWNWW